ncbi:hypothetical protein [Chitinophaga rhizosphaerae]|uniref:hypothetical protein n=1 Tax=Chitinophaga rhizosphaerae TaxID=1864947 RepID=UPI000F812B2F|nr:hypothetical protein [Chitinophaga rhizosphaerae]
MKLNKLFGVQFAQNELAKEKILQHYQAWKNKQFVEYVSAGFLDPKEVEHDPNVIKGVDGRLKLDFSGTRRLLSEQDCKHYLIMNSVLEMGEKVRVKEPFELEWLNQVSDGKRQLSFGDTFIRYEKSGNRINALAARNSKTSEGSSYLSYSFFNFDLAQKSISEHYAADDYDNGAPMPLKDFDAYAKTTLYQLIIFMELADIEEVILPPGRSHGVRKNQEKVLNDARFPITKVTTSWNKVIRTSGFDVRGHIRKQRWGPQNKYRKLIWIDQFHKEGCSIGARATKAQPRIIEPESISRGQRRK